MLCVCVMMIGKAVYTCTVLVTHHLDLSRCPLLHKSLQPPPWYQPCKVWPVYVYSQCIMKVFSVRMWVHYDLNDFFVFLICYGRDLCCWLEKCCEITVKVENLEILEKSSMHSLVSLCHIVQYKLVNCLIIVEVVLMLSCWNYGEFNVTKIFTRQKTLLIWILYSIKFVLNISIEVLIVIIYNWIFLWQFVGRLELV